MSLSSIKTAATVKAGQTALKLQKNSPNILFGLGVVGVVGAAVLASRATLRLHDTLDEIEEKKKIIEDSRAGYSEENYRHNTILVRVHGVQEIAKLYAPAVVVGTLSVLALTKSHMILTQRNTALMAAYSAVDKAFKQYRLRVVDEYGEEKDQEFRFGTKNVVEKVVDDEGNTKEVEKSLLDPDLPSQYAKFFDEFSPNWEPVPQHNFMFLNQQQQYANNRLKARGYVTLNEVYEALGFPTTPYGQLVGWLKNPKDPNDDNFIDFGIYSKGEASASFVNGPEYSILLDFNVQGVIYDMLGD